MSEKSKFVHFLIDVEVQVTDPISVTTANSGIAEGENGPELFTGLTGEGWNEGSIAARALLQGVNERSEEVGLTVLSASPVPRPLHENGYYSEVTLPASPRRQADGSYVDPPGFPPMPSDN